MSDYKDLLVIGIGNPYRSDDGIGAYVIDQFQDYEYDDIEFIKMNPDGYQLLEIWENRECVILIDAAKSGKAIGTIIHFDALKESVPRNISPVSSHSINLAETITLAQTLNQLPGQLLVYAIEAANMNYGTQLTAKVKESGKQVVREIGKFIEEKRAGM